MVDEIRVEVPEFGKRENFTPTTAGPVLRSGHSAVELMRWGFNATGPGAKPHLLINARSETVSQLRSFKTAWHSRRCLIPADWFYEWDQTTTPKQPWRFVRDHDAAMIFAGIWSPGRMPDGSMVDGYAILTTAANEVVGQIHDRMPVILHEADWPAWLDPSTKPEHLQSLHRPYEGKMYARPVEVALNKASFQGEVHDVNLKQPESPSQGELLL